MVIMREYNEKTDGFSTDKNESYRIVRDRIKKYWKKHNGKLIGGTNGYNKGIYSQNGWM